MKEQPGQYPELPLTPEDKTNLTEIVSWVNGTVKKQFPIIPPLNIDQIKFISNEDFAQSMTTKAQEMLHPFFLKIISDKVPFGVPGAHSSTYPDSNTVLFDQSVLEDLRNDQTAGYFGIGLDLINASIAMGTNHIEVKSEKATQVAIQMLTRSFQELAGIIDPDDLKNAINYLQKNGSHILITGIVFSIMVEEKMFMPQTGLILQELLTQYLARPSALAYTRKLSDQFSLPFAQSVALERTANRRMSLVASHFGDPVRMEQELLEILERLGFRGRNAIAEGYLNGNIAKKMAGLA